jgi:hypothetical protein
LRAPPTGTRRVGALVRGLLAIHSGTAAPLVAALGLLALVAPAAHLLSRSTANWAASCS